MATLSVHDKKAGDEMFHEFLPLIKMVLWMRGTLSKKL